MLRLFDIGDEVRVVCGSMRGFLGQVTQRLDGGRYVIDMHTTHLGTAISPKMDFECRANALFPVKSSA